MVIGKVPVGVEDDVARVSVELEPAVTEAGLNVAVAPAGRPEADNDTVPVKPPTAVVDTVVVVEPPTVTDPEAGAALMVKSGAGLMVQVKLVEPEAPVVSVAVTVTVEVPAVVGGPGDRPGVAVVGRAAGSPGGPVVRGWAGGGAGGGVWRGAG